MTVDQLAYKIRRHAIEMTSSGKSSHVGAVLSIADILAVLYGKIMNIRPGNPSWPDRDRFILSKGHAGAGVYAALAECGFFDPELLKGHYQNGAIFSGHVSHKGIPGVEVSTGSLGHGLSIGTGMALAAKMDNKNFRTYVLMSDGECDEGSVWEAVLFAAHHKLDNLIAVIDYNKIQSLDLVSNTIMLEPFADKWISFGWNVVQADGHSTEELIKIFSKIKSNGSGKPLVVICNTTKGKGVSFMENSVLWHYRSPQGEEYNAAVAELEKNYAHCIH